ncbi:MAG: iron-containing alcohol dehydrogenase [bacterium]
MDTLKRIIHQLGIGIFSFFATLLPMPIPVTFAGRGSAGELCSAIGQLKPTRILLVTDKILVQLGIVQKVQDALAAAGVETAVYDGVEPNPTFAQAEDGLARFKSEGCDAVLGIGGGSPIDIAKIVAANATNTKNVRKLAGMFRIRRLPVPLFAIPTTAGTGSETTIVAVASDPITHNKSQFIDPKLVPLMTALDPEIMAGLPAPITAATGMDALTHAIESFLSKSSNAETERYVRMAIPLIFANLPKAYREGSDLGARSAMSMASYYAGIAFTRTSVGYVHAIAHTFGAYYNTPHGLANAITLPHILAFSQPAAEARLARLAEMIGLEGSTDAAKAGVFLGAIRDLMDTLDIPAHLDSLKPGDIPAIASQALAEAWCNYPVPRYMEQAECESILRAIAPASSEAAAAHG